MIKKLALLGTMAGLIAELAACGYNPQTSRLSNYQQCQSLQQQMVFANGFNPATTTNFQYNQNRQQLNQQFQSMHCYDVLEQSRASQPQK